MRPESQSPVKVPGVPTCSINLGEYTSVPISIVPDNFLQSFSRIVGHFILYCFS